LVYGLVAAIYLLAFPWHPGLRSPNELCRLMQTRALVDFGDLSLNRAMRLYGPVGDLSISRGRYYPSKAPLMSFAGVPVYALLRALAGGRPGVVPEIPLVYLSRLFLTVLPTLLSLLLLERLLRQYVATSIAIGTTLTYALGTLAFSYSLLFMSHQTSATLLLAGFYVAWRVARGERTEWWLAASGMLLGLAVVAEYTSALPALFIAAYGLVQGRASLSQRLRSAGLLAIGAVPAGVFLGWYHFTCFGGILETGYRHLADVAYQPWHEGGFLGIRTPTWTAFVGSFFSPLRGLFALSPFLLLGFLGLTRLWRAQSAHPELRGVAIFSAALCIAYVYFTSSFSYESWGWTTGPRHLTGLVPFLMLPVALILHSNTTPVRQGVAAGLALSSVLVTSALTFVNYIPDDVSEGVFGLFLPLARDGDVIPTALGFLGISNPAGGWVIIAVTILVGLAICTLLLSTLSWYHTGVAATVAVAFLASHRLLAQDTDHDRAARALLERVWLAPSGESVAFWSTTGRTSH